MLNVHKGWEEQSNGILRCQLAITLPSEGACRVWVNGATQNHAEGKFIVFDDSRDHTACCEDAPTKQERIVLIIDMSRPSSVPKGIADSKGPVFDGIKAYFTSEGQIDKY